MTVVKLVVSSPNNAPLEKAYAPDLSLEEFKQKLELITGIEAPNQTLSFATSGGDALPTPVRLSELPGGTHVTVSGSGGTFEIVPPYKMRDEDYEGLPESLRAFKRRHQLGRFAPQKPEVETKVEAPLNPDIELGKRCEVQVSSMPKRGEIKFIGETHFKPGIWIGVAYDEPVGKNDGSVEGRRYFSCQNGHGAFVRADKVVVADLPPLLDEDFEEI